MMNIFGFGKKRETPPLEEKTQSIYDGFVELRQFATDKYSSAYTACLSWGQRSTVEVQFIAEKLVKDNWVDTPLPIELLNNSDGMSFQQRIQATYTDHVLGNSYWLKLKNEKGKVVGFQFIPSSTVTINKNDNGVGIKSYSVNGRDSVLPKDMIHFRFGTDPNDHLSGFNKWAVLEALNASDYYACIYQAALLQSPSPSLIAINKGAIKKEESDKLSARFREVTSIRGAGNIIPVAGDWDFKNLNYSPKDLDITVIADFIEERVCAVMGIPQQVVGLGENKSTYSNMKEAIKMAILNHTLPILTTISQTLYSQCPEIFYDPNFRLRVDWEDTWAMQDNLESESKRVGDLYKAGVISRGEAKSALGLEPTPEEFSTYSKPEVNPNAS